MNKKKQIHSWINEDVMIEFKVWCVRKKIKIEDAVETALASWTKKQRPTNNND